MLLWKERQGRVLRLHDYEQFGGLAGALEQQAERIYAHFSSTEQEQCRLVFLRLVQPGEGTTDTRRRANLDEFDQQANRERIIRQLADARLLTTQGDDEQAFVEVSHEALIRSWSRLRGWVDAEREYLRIQHQISSSAKEWEQHDKDNAWLLTGSRLGAAEEWLQQHPEQSSTLERQFIEISTEKSNIEKLKAIKTQKQLRWRSRIMTFVAVIMCCVAMIAWHFSEQSKQKELQSNYNLAKAFEEKALFSLEKSHKEESISKKIQYYKDAWLYTLEAQKIEEKQGVPILNNRTLGELTLVDEELLMPKTIDYPSSSLNFIITTSAYSLDGNVLAIGSSDRNSKNNNIELWDARSGRFKSNLVGHTDGVSVLKYSPFGNILASGSEDHTIRLWDTVTGQELRIFSGHDSTISALAYHPTGKLLASSDYNGTIIFWDLDSGKQAASLKGSSGISSLAYRQDGAVLAIGSGNFITLWDMNQFKSFKVLDHHAKVSDIKYSPDGSILFSVSSDYSPVKFWNGTTGEEIKTLSNQKIQAKALAFSKDGQTLVTGDNDSIKLWNIKYGKTPKLSEHKSFNYHFDDISAIMYSPDNNNIAIAVKNSMLFFDINKNTLLNSSSYLNSISHLSISPDGELFAVGRNNERIEIWSIKTKKILRTINKNRGYISHLEFSPNGKTIISSSIGDDTVKIWSIQSGEEILSIQNERGSICVSGSYPSSSESKECSAASPRFLMLCRYSKKAR